MQRFEAAPWSTYLKLVSAFSGVVLVALAVVLPNAMTHAGHALLSDDLRALVPYVPPAVLAGALLFVVQGYELDGGILLVRRPLWSTNVRLDGLERAWQDPAAMRRSMRIFGNGGLFSITGLYRNSALGTYRTFVTDPRLAVVLKTPARVVIVSPARPEAFLAALAARFPGLSRDKLPAPG